MRQIWQLSFFFAISLTDGEPFIQLLLVPVWQDLMITIYRMRSHHQQQHHPANSSSLAHSFALEKSREKQRKKFTCHRVSSGRPILWFLLSFLWIKLFLFCLWDRWFLSCIELAGWLVGRSLFSLGNVWRPVGLESTFSTLLCWWGILWLINIFVPPTREQKQAAPGHGYNYYSVQLFVAERLPPFGFIKVDPPPGLVNVVVAGCYCYNYEYPRLLVCCVVWFPYTLIHDDDVDDG